jgi:hypothetical protein
VGAGARATPGEFALSPAASRTAAVVAIVLGLAVVGERLSGGGHGGEAEAATLGAPENPDGTLPMPFERPGDSFPGSAFYYLDAGGGNGGASLAPGAHWDAEAGGDVGPAAQALRQAGTALDRTRALACLTAAVYYEAASEPDAGQRAVAQVVLNRMAHPAYPKTVCGVVYQGSERATGCQFTFTCDGALARKPVRLFWERAEAVARAALAGYVYAPVGLATHYHTFAVHPYWADSLHFLGQIGAHRFYRMEGPAGGAAAFRFAYAGGEPEAVAHARDPRAAAMAQSAPDPLAIEQAYAASLRAAGGDAAKAWTATAARLNAAAVPPAPVYAGEALQRGGDAAFRAHALPGGDTIRSEYEASGTWIATPE